MVTPTEDKYSKELDWCVPEPLNINQWERHPMYRIIQRYKGYFTGKVADFGCNNAIGCCILSDVHTVQTVTGFDISRVALNEGAEVIRNRDKTCPEKITLMYSSLTDIDSRDNAFDAGICFHTIEHIYPDDLDTVLSEFARVIKPGGYLVISLPCKFAFMSAPAHVAYFSIEPHAGCFTLPEELEKHGFTVIEMFQDSTLNNKEQLCITGIVRRNNGES